MNNKEIIIKNAIVKNCDEEILKIDNLEFHTGINIIVGENGAGKSSFFSSLFKKEDYVLEGEINIDNYPKLQTFELVKLGYYLVQQQNMVVDNLTYEVLWKHMAEINNITVNWEEIYNFFPIAQEKLNNIIGTCSGGENRIMELIPVFILNPEYVFLDEIDSGLSSIHKEQLIKFLIHFKLEKTFVLITHQKEDFNELEAQEFVLVEGTIK